MGSYNPPTKTERIQQRIQTPRNITYNTFKKLNKKEEDIKKLKDITDLYYNKDKDVLYQQAYNDIIEKENSKRRHLKEYLKTIKDNYFTIKKTDINPLYDKTNDNVIMIR